MARQWNVAGYPPVCLPSCSSPVDAFRIATTDVLACLTLAEDSLYGHGHLSGLDIELDGLVAISSHDSPELAPLPYLTGLATLALPEGIAIVSFETAVRLAGLDDPWIRVLDAEWADADNLTVGLIVRQPHLPEATIERLVRKAERLLASS